MTVVVVDGSEVVEVVAKKVVVMVMGMVAHTAEKLTTIVIQVQLQCVWRKDDIACARVYAYVWLFILRASFFH